MRRYIGFALWCLIATIGAVVWAQETAKPSDTKQSPKEPEQASNPTTPLAITVLLRDGTPVKLKLLHTLNSKTVVLDDPLNFSLAEDVVVDGKLVVKAGAPAIGRVRRAKPARTMGRGAELELEIQYVRAGTVHVALRGSQIRQGESKTGDTVALTVLFGLSGLVKHGSEIEIKEGALFTAYVDTDTAIPAPPEAMKAEPQVN